MIKISRKILATFLLSAVLVIAGGFSDGMNASASGGNKMKSMNEAIGVQNQVMHYAVEDALLQQDNPLDNSLKPCCENKQGGALAVQATTSSQNVKFSMIDFAKPFSIDNSVFESKITDSSSASPPKPDVLSSILKKE